MALNKVKGNMYDFITHTWNTVKGKCFHDCHYCYMKRFRNQPELHFDEKELKTDLGEMNYIFVGSSCDMWHPLNKESWIVDTLDHCNQFANRYLFQSKDPSGFYTWKDYIPASSILCVTLETNRIYPQMGKTPSLHERSLIMSMNKNFNKMVTVEPIFDFDLDIFVDLIKQCNPNVQVNIGADSGAHKLPEPEPEKIRELIKELEKFTTVKLKSNLKRLLPDMDELFSGTKE